MVFQKGVHYNKGKKFSIEHRDKLSNVRKEKMKLGIIKPLNYWKGKKRYKETKEKISKKLKGIIRGVQTNEHIEKRIKTRKKNGWIKDIEAQRKKISENKERSRKISESKKGHITTIETKKKMRLSKIKYIQRCLNNNLPIHPTIGNNETQILNRIEQELNCKIIRQYLVDGYFVDGYIPQINVVIEVDERPKNRERDIERENYIKNKLNCKFIRIKDY